jgi:hypothetical protein
MTPRINITLSESIYPEDIETLLESLFKTGFFS